MAKQTNLFGGWAGKPNSKSRCLESEESWKAVAPWPHTADMNLPTSLPTTCTCLKVVDHPVPGMLCTWCKKYNKVPRSGNWWGHWVHVHIIILAHVHIMMYM